MMLGFWASHPKKVVNLHRSSTVNPRWRRSLYLGFSVIAGGPIGCARPVDCSPDVAFVGRFQCILRTAFGPSPVTRPSNEQQPRNVPRVNDVKLGAGLR